ncbi:zincin [Cylindrobasidium torrendii FP15055 ss-10]|uniref:Zincin n=1 Tax=Cylindrobasidium torrendii FP15055 ss-10 TaxID=1314674 RepID=A0A0D7B7L8_9AGAR|nr:zincin [Cylindrobasidium torrendii FP15055 ss-10]
MFSARAALFALIAATSASAAGISVNLNLLNILVTGIVVNIGDTRVKLLNEPNSLLSTKFPTDVFSITNSEGHAPAFTGVKVKYSPERAAKSNDDSVFTILEPGESISLKHNLASAYNFSSIGQGLFTIKPSRTVFTLVDDDGNLSSIQAEVQDATSTIITTLADILHIPRTTGFSKRASYIGCSSSQQGLIDEATAAAQGYVEESSSYLNSNPLSTDRFATWFGTYTDARHSTVASHYSNMLDNPYSQYTYDCSTCSEAYAYAYVHPDDDTTIYLCPAFWETTTTGSDSRAGTLIHESSYFAGTDDVVYGTSGAAKLASSNPDSAVNNADNYEYFAENA